MNKREFLASLTEALAALPTEDISERINFYGEMIDDRVEDGLGEEEAVASIGNVEDIVEQTVAELPLKKLIKSKARSNRKMKAWEIVLLAVGSPLWVTLLLSVFAVAIALYAIIWSAVAVAWAVFVTFAGCTLGGIALGVLSICFGRLLEGIAAIGLAIASAGFAIFAFFGALMLTKLVALLTKKVFIGIKKMLFRRK